MTKRKLQSFWIGFFLAFVGGVLLWYWQKSTSADEGALDLLDELAKVKAKLEGMQKGKTEETAVPQGTPSTQAAPPDDLTTINGIGPVYAQRLQEAGITTFAILATQEPAQVGKIVQIKAWQAASPAEWIAQAKELVQ